MPGRADRSRDRARPDLRERAQARHAIRRCFPRDARDRPGRLTRQTDARRLHRRGQGAPASECCRTESRPARARRPTRRAGPSARTRGRESSVSCRTPDPWRAFSSPARSPRHIFAPGNTCARGPCSTRGPAGRVRSRGVQLPPLRRNARARPGSSHASFAPRDRWDPARSQL